jgi:hypothetical protein
MKLRKWENGTDLQHHCRYCYGYHHYCTCVPCIHLHIRELPTQGSQRNERMNDRYLLTACSKCNWKKKKKALRTIQTYKPFKFSEWYIQTLNDKFNNIEASYQPMSYFYVIPLHLHFTLSKNPYLCDSGCGGLSSPQEHEELELDPDYVTILIACHLQPFPRPM